MSDSVLRAYQPTPLHARTAELCATNVWVEECGFTVPALYTSASEEQNALAHGVALSDLSPRQTWVFDGPEAGAYLSFATIDEASRLPTGQTLRTAWCDDLGFVRGAGVVTRIAEAQFELTTTVRDFAWFVDGARGFDVKVANATGARAAIGVRGPLAEELLTLAGLTVQTANANDVVRPSWRAAPVALMRTDEGFELSTQADDGVVVWDRLWRSGAGIGVIAAGAGALDVSRVERGAPKAGLDWQAVQLVRNDSEPRRPQDIGFTPDLTRRFNGVQSLRRMPGQGRQVLVQLSADEPLAAGPLTVRNLHAGNITSAAWSETRACALAIAWLDVDAVGVGEKLSAPGRTGVASAEVVRPLFAKTNAL